MSPCHHPHVMRRHVRASLLLLGTAIALLLPVVAAAAGPPFPPPVDGQAVYDTAGILSDGGDRGRRGDDRCHRGADRGRDRRLYPARRLRRDHRGDRVARPRAHRPMGRRPARVRRRPCHLFRHRPVPRARSGAALRRAWIRGDVPDQQRAPGDLRRRHGAVPAERRLRRGARHRARPDLHRRDAGERRAPRGAGGSSMPCWV